MLVRIQSYSQILNEYRLLGDKVIRNHIRGMDYEVVGY